MPISYNKRNRRWVFQFNRVIAGKRYRSDRLLPKGWSRERADAYDRQEVGRLYALATGVVSAEPLIEDAVLLYLERRAPQLKSFANIVRELAAFQDAYAGKTFSELGAISQNYKPTKDDGTPLKPATVRNRLAYLRAACRYAWKHHKMGKHNPSEGMEFPLVSNERHTYLNRRQFIEVLRKMRPGSDRAAVRISFYSGMRVSESTRALAEDDTFKLDDTKNGRPRHIPIHPKLAHIVRNPALWPLKHTRWTISTKFKKAARAAGYAGAGWEGVRFHDMRHSSASAMVNAGVDLYTVGGVLGHKSAASTKRYSHLATETLADAVGRIGKNRRTQGKKKTA